MLDKSKYSTVLGTLALSAVLGGCAAGNFSSKGIIDGADQAITGSASFVSDGTLVSALDTSFELADANFYSQGFSSFYFSFNSDCSIMVVDVTSYVRDEVWPLVASFDAALFPNADVTAGVTAYLCAATREGVSMKLSEASAVASANQAIGVGTGLTVVTIKDSNGSPVASEVGGETPVD